MSDSIQSIDYLFYLQHICPYNQTLHYHFREFLASLFKSINSLIICNLIILILQYYFEKSLLVDSFYKIDWSAVLFTFDFSLQSDYTLSISKITCTLWNYIHSSIICNITLLILHYYFKNISLLTDSKQYIDRLFRLHYTCPWNHTIHYHCQKSPHTWESTYILLIISNLILLILHRHFKKSPLVNWFYTIYILAVSFTSDLYLQ